MASMAQRVGSLFYLVGPNTTTFRHQEDVPNYINEAVPVMTFLITLESIIHYLVGRPTRLNEAFSSMGLGILHEATGFLSSWVVLLGYNWLYQYRLWDLPWDSPYTWFGAFIFVDFCYYWIHRANHELNILWAVHQLHHSSEDFNLATSLRLSILQRAAHFGFYQPLALLGFPLPTVTVHVAFNYLFQFWVHTDFVGTLGPIGWVFMTPSYHRVHHGANKWCLDKNYASVFIIWDCIFGTFEPERENVEIVYGLTEQPQTHNVLWHEFFYFGMLYSKVRNMSTWGDSLKALFYGPGWSPGAPRLGDPSSFQNVKAPRIKYNPQLPMWQVVYVYSHLLLALMAQQLLAAKYTAASWPTVLRFLAFIFMSVGVLSAMYDRWRWAPVAEAARCAIYIAYAYNTFVTDILFIDTALLVYFVMSMLLWTTQSLGVLSTHFKSNKLE
ncbi:alkylglycerol monooxygenase-like [Panulirus ornatus]|uniref:alkylglycerol monooxygenase-like n=1 Tax=Panulirus ornatus TaxID=150431 RepID=UPI003A8AA7DC